MSERTLFVSNEILGVITIFATVCFSMFRTHICTRMCTISISNDENGGKALRYQDLGL